VVFETFTSVPLYGTIEFLKVIYARGKDVRQLKGSYVLRVVRFLAQPERKTEALTGLDFVVGWPW